jgi:thioredoxin-related protein
MSGFTGTNGNAVFFKLGISLFLLITASLNVQADIFNNRNIESSVLTVKEKSSKDTVLLFITPQCPWCEKALDNLRRFKKRNPRVDVQVHVLASVKEFIEFSRVQLARYPKDLTYTLDFKNSLADSYGIMQTPAYIIILQDQTKKVEGYVDLAHFNMHDDH